MTTTTREKQHVDSSERAANSAPQEPTGAKKILTTVMESRPVRAVQRYGAARGALLAGGIAYSALFSIVAALTIAWTVFMATLGGNQALRSDVIRAVNAVLPGILDDGTGSGMVNPDSLVLDSVFNPASAVAALVLLWTAVSIMTNIRSGVQTMFGIAAPAENFALQKVRDLIGFIGMAIGIVLSSMLGTAAGTMGRTVLGAFGLADNPVSGFLLRVVGFAVAAGIAAITFACLFRVTAAVRPPSKDLWLGSAIGGALVQIVLTLGTSLVSSVSDNPLLAASAGIATLLLFVNLLCRVLLIVAAFTANPPASVKPTTPEEVHFDETPNFVTLSAPPHSRLAVPGHHRSGGGRSPAPPSGRRGVRRRPHRHGPRHRHPPRRHPDRGRAPQRPAAQRPHRHADPPRGEGRRAARTPRPAAAHRGRREGLLGPPGPDRTSPQRHRLQPERRTEKTYVQLDTFLAAQG